MNRIEPTRKAARVDCSECPWPERTTQRGCPANSGDHHVTIRNGFSSRPMNSCIHWAATAPSTGRWSTDRVNRIVRATAHCPPLDDDGLACRADREDRGLRGVDDRGEVLGAVHAEIRHRHAAADELVGSELALAGPRGEVPRRRGQSREVHGVHGA